MSDNNRKREYRRTVELQKKGTGASDPRRVKKSRAPQKKSGAVVHRQKADNRSLVQIVRDRAVDIRRKKDERWEAKDVQRVRHGVDRPMLVIIIVLLILGTVMVFSASYPNALIEKDNSLHYIKRQLLWVAAGTAAMLLASAVPYHLFKKATPALTIASLALLLLVLVIGTAEGVARRWIMVGPLTVQPSEIAKCALIMTLAYYIENNFNTKKVKLDKKQAYLKGIIVPGVILAVFCGLVLLEKHLSGTVVLCLIGVSIIFVAGADVLKLALTYGIPAVCAAGIYLATNSYALERITTHNDENADVLAEAWQTTQGLYAIGSGGLLGLGLGDSNLKYNYVSAAHNDFIFTIWCEEMGFVGAVLLIALYGLFVWRGIVIAKKAPDTFSSLVAFGITFQVGIQAVLNIMVVTNLVPNTGISLPFFSYGGSALIMLMGEMGILLSISKHSYQNK